MVVRREGVSAGRRREGSDGRVVVDITTEERLQERKVRAEAPVARPRCSEPATATAHLAAGRAVAAHTHTRQARANTSCDDSPTPCAATITGGFSSECFGTYSHAWHLTPEQGKVSTRLLYAAVSCGSSAAVLVVLRGMGPGMMPMSLQHTISTPLLAADMAAHNSSWPVRGGVQLQYCGGGWVPTRAVLSWPRSRGRGSPATSLCPCSVVQQ